MTFATRAQSGKPGSATPAMSIAAVVARLIVKYRLAGGTNGQ